MKIKKLGSVDCPDEHGETCTSYVVLEFEEGATEKEFDEYLVEHFPQSSCSHAHDCCGGWYAPHGGKLLFRNSYIAVIEYYEHKNV